MKKIGSSPPLITMPATPGTKELNPPSRPMQVTPNKPNPLRPTSIQPPFVECVWRNYIVMCNARLFWIFYGIDFPCNNEKIWRTCFQNRRRWLNIGQQAGQIEYDTKCLNNKRACTERNFNLRRRRTNSQWNRNLWGPDGELCIQKPSVGRVVWVQTNGVVARYELGKFLFAPVIGWSD